MKNGYLVFIFLCSFFTMTYAQKDTINSDVFWPIGILADSDTLYIVEANFGKISKLDLNDPQFSKVDVVTGINRPNNLALKGNDLYITNYFDGQILKVDVSQTNPTLDTIITDLDTPYDLAINGNDLYWSEHEAGQILRIDISQNDIVVDTVITGVASPYCFEIRGNELYYTEFLGGKISKIDLSQTTPTPVDVITGLDGPIALKLNGNDLYFSEYNISGAFKTDISESNPTKTIFDTNVVAGDFVLQNDALYASDFFNSLILRYDGIPTPILDLENSKSKLEVFPNPSSDFIAVKHLRGSVNYSILDAQGKNIGNARLFENEFIDIRDLEQGIYILFLENEIPLKFVKK